MATKGPVEGSSIGFDFSNYARNQFLGQRLNGLPRGEDPHDQREG
jgi:20S proteasome subunit beta 2